MGIVGTIREHCITDDEDPLMQTLSNNSKIISEDFAYFQQENWYRLIDTLLFDHNKFIFLYNNYKAEQTHLLNLWKIVDIKKLKSTHKHRQSSQILSERWKHVIRKGVPIVHYRSMIEVLLDRGSKKNDSERLYRSKLHEQLKKRNNKVEICSFQEEGQEAFITPFLNIKGEEALKSIAFLLKVKQGKLQYNPYFINVLALMLIFVKESDVFEMAQTLVQSSANMSVDRQEALVWHCVLTGYQFEKLAHEFYKKVKKISPTINIINSHLNSEGIEKIKIFKEIVGKFFFGYLPFPIILKIFMIYLNEGVQICYRIFYAILKITSAEIRDAKNTKQILRIIKTKLLVDLTDPEIMKRFFRLAFDLRLSPIINLKKLEIESMSRHSDDVYYLPEIIGESEILSYQDLQSIWGFLPEVIKHYDIRRIYSLSQSVGGYKQMINSLTVCDFTLIIIQTIDENVFGVFLAQKMKSEAQIKALQKAKMAHSTPIGLQVKYPPDFKMTTSSPCTEMPEQSSFLSQSNKRERTYSNKANSNKQLLYFGSSESFVFTISPKKKKFGSSGQNVFYCTYTDDYMIIGGPMSKPALQLDSSLSVGLSFNCPTYNSLPLHSGPPGELKIQKIQCFSIE